QLVRLAKRLKKEKVSVDVINFGEDETNQSLLSSFVDSVNGKDGSGSHLVTVPAGAMLHDSLVSSPIILGDDGSGAVPGFGMEFGIDPNEDPELALALRVSLEDQRMRQEAEAQRQTTGTAAVGESVSTESTNQGTGLGQSALPGGTSEEAQLQQALNMSIVGGTTATVGEVSDLASMTEDEQIAYALQMSLNQAEEIQKKESQAKEDNIKVRCFRILRYQTKYWV
ncbi:UNVERIFIED_CONTAM: hypothetical protein GTU68_029806, partial [Idotea baltica]|nr:hypothetical protein [Idotea baltica]